MILISKAEQGMFKYALKTNNYDISHSIMIGDKISDLIPASLRVK